MDDRRSIKRRALLVGGACGLLMVLGLGLMLFGFNPLSSTPSWETVFGRTAKGLQIVSAMRVGLSASADAEKNAVLAESDEESVDFADQARRSGAAVEEARTKLAPLIEAGGVAKEKELFQRFSIAWEELRRTDDEILRLAVLNSNLKAARLSYGPALDTLARFEQGLSGLMEQAGSSPDGRTVERLCCRAAIAAYKIQALQAPHIAEANEGRMEELERRMGENHEAVRNSLASLAQVPGLAGSPKLAEAGAAYADYGRIVAQIVELSRQNTNIRSLALSLGRKRNLQAQCEDALAALDESIRARGFKATR
jgi:hypothetical protein